jgi:hypothetical protein
MPSFSKTQHIFISADKNKYGMILLPFRETDAMQAAVKHKDCDAVLSRAWSAREVAPNGMGVDGSKGI